MHIPLTHCKTHISECQDDIYRRRPTVAVFAVSSAAQHCGLTSIYLRANRRQWRAPLTISAANQRSPVAKRMNRVQTSTWMRRSCSFQAQILAGIEGKGLQVIITINHTPHISQSHDSFLDTVSSLLLAFSNVWLSAWGCVRNNQDYCPNQNLLSQILQTL